MSAVSRLFFGSVGCLKNSLKPEVARIAALPQRALSSDEPSPIP